MPRVSVIIPAYNAESYVETCVQSALNQSYTDREVIVVNDGSTDSTAEKLEPLLEQIVFVDQINRGPAAARNRGLEHARGEYIALLDADDLWMPNRLERMVTFMDARPDLGFSTSDAFLLVDDRPLGITYYHHLPSKRRFKAERQAYWILQFQFVFVMAVVRANLFEQHGLFDENIRGCEDWDMWARFILEGETVGLLDEPLAYYRIHKSSLSYDRTDIVTEELAVLRKAALHPRGNDIEGLQGRIQLLNGKLALSHSQFDEAAAQMKLAAKDTGLDWQTRFRAGGTAMFPRLAWAAHRMRVSRRERIKNPHRE